MRARIFYWLKVSLGFSKKESEGFVLLVPLLLILFLSPDIIHLFKQSNSKSFQEFHLKKIDSLTQAGFTFAESPRALFDPADTAKTTSASSRQLENINRIDFSEADSTTLQIVPGIGPATAARIIKFRENLGGMHDPIQLHDVYGVDEELAELIWEFFEFKPGVRKTLAINELEVQELATHPYISYGEAKVLVAYRNQHGKYQSADDLKKIKIFKDEWIAKISPYLAFE